MIIDGSTYEICNDDRFDSILVQLMDKIVKIHKVLIAKTHELTKYNSNL